MADILYDTRLKSEEAPKVIILTHGDADGLVSAMIVRAFEELQNKNKTFLIMSVWMLLWSKQIKLLIISVSIHL